MKHTPSPITEHKVLMENGVTGTKLQGIRTGDDGTYPVRHHDDMKWYWHKETNGAPVAPKVDKGYTVIGEYADD